MFEAVLLVLLFAFAVFQLVKLGRDLRKQKPLTKAELHELFHGEQERRRFANALKKSNAWHPSPNKEKR